MPVQRPLTPRQDLILRSVARGRTNKDIAAELGISEQGVKVHVSRLLERYGAENRVELVSLARAWPDPDERAYAELSGDIAEIRAGLNRTYQEAGALGALRAGKGHVRAAAPSGKNGHSPNGSDLSAEVSALREVLTEINVALKLAGEMPATTDVGPLVDAIRKRVGVALERSAKLDALVDGRRNADRSSRQNST
jgi:DNA-binding CsgD family transcriptional regulator